MNIVFMGTPDFAVESLSKIYEAGHNVLAVVSQPDKPSGRGMKLRPTPVKEYAESKGIKVFQTGKIRNDEELINTIRSLKPDVIVVVAFGQILPETVLNIPKYGSINVHASLLPKYRGAAPIQWAVINGEEETGITTMYMDKGMDTGDMILKERVKIEPSDTFGDVYLKLKKVGGKLIVETLEKVADGLAPREKQPTEFTLAPMINKEVCKIDWSKSAKQINDLIRGLNPMPGAYTAFGDSIYKIWEANVEDYVSDELPGTIVLADKKRGIHVATGNGVLSIIQIQAQNGKRMNVLDYLRGNNEFKQGEMFF